MIRAAFRPKYCIRAIIIRLPKIALSGGSEAVSIMHKLKNNNSLNFIS